MKWLSVTAQHPSLSDTAMCFQLLRIFMLPFCLAVCNCCRCRASQAAPVGTSPRQNLSGDHCQSSLVLAFVASAAAVTLIGTGQSIADKELIQLCWSHIYQARSDLECCNGLSHNQLAAAAAAQ